MVKKDNKGRILNKKGTLDDLVFIIMGLMTISIIMLVSYKYVNEFKNEIINSGLADPLGEEAITKVDNLFPTTIDNSMLLLMIFLMIGALILSSLVVIHPGFFVVYIIFMTFVIVVGGIVSDVYQQMAADPEMVLLASKLIWTSHIMKYLPVIIGVFGFIIAIIMYKAWENRQ